MKKSLLLILCTLFSCGLWAVSRNAQQAQQLVTDFVNSNARLQATSAKQAPLTLCYTALQKNGNPAFYVFNRGENDGFVVVSAESRTHEVLGYANNGHFDVNNLPDNMRAWLDGYTEAITYAASLPERTNTKRAKRAPKTYSPISPLCSTQWGQGNPYNLKCPTDNEQLCVTGCVATAAAQVMKFNNYPTTGKGKHSYYWYRTENDSVLLTADFGSTTYNWSQMLNIYSSSATTAQKDAVATIMSHCGIACDMNYGTGTSGAYMPYMINAFVHNFRYNAAIKTICKDYMPESQFLDDIIADLQAGYPCLFSGRTVNDEGHAFVCDGLDANGLVHINWGWNGYCDNYFRVSALDPKDQGTGGSEGDLAFTEQVKVYTNIRPSEGGLFQPCITVNALYANGTSFAKQDEIYFTSEILQNQGIEYWEGKPAVQIYKNGSLYDTWIDNFTAGLGISWYYNYIYFKPNLSALPAGEYEMVPAVKSTLSSFATALSPVMVKNIGEYRCQVKVTNDSIFITPPDAETPDDGVPTVEYLSNLYDTENNVVLCMTFDDAPCGDVYFVGTPTNWKASFNNCPKFEALPDYEGWYAVSVPYSSDLYGKPIQAELDGTFLWDNQCGDPGAWINKGGKGSKTANIFSGYGEESDIAYPSAGCYIYELAYWKLHKNNPCSNRQKHNYFIAIFAPDACDDMKPAIIGSFNNWEQGVAMTPDTIDGSVYYYAIINDWAEGTFKFREASDMSWSNQLQYYNESTNTWNDFPNFVLPEVTKDTTIVYNFSVNAYYRYAQCVVDYYNVWVQFALPEGTPSAVDITGSFDGWTGTPMNYETSGDYWYTTIRAAASDNLVIVEHNNWDNPLLVFDNDDNKWYNFNYRISGLWKEDSDGKYIAYNLTNTEHFRWSATPVDTKIENVNTDDSSTQKILKNGQLRVIRNGIMYDMTGAKLK